MAISIDLSGRNALVTGGTRGIGRTISIRLAEAGARVGMIYRADDAAADETLSMLAGTAERGHFALKADIGDPEAVRSVMAQVREMLGDELDMLVLNAASGGSGAISDLSLEAWSKPFQVNVHGHFLLLQEAKPAIRRGASVVFISSGAGHDPIAGLGAYGTSKAAVNHFAAVLAQEWGPDGIRVNVVSPGHTAIKPVDYENLTDKQRGIVETTALRRIGTAGDIANAVILMSSDLGGFITGQTVRVNGGRT